MAKLLIIGKMPPPIGGVSMHVKRLTESLRRKEFGFGFCDTGTTSVYRILIKIIEYNTIHIHVSNPAVQLATAIFCRLAGKKLIITYHGAWGRYDAVGNRAVKLSARLAYIPIVQERAGLVQALRCNPRSREISTYIADPEIRPLPASLQSEIAFRRKFYLATFCTNAWNVTFDKHGREIYGISEMIDRFADYPEYQLVISDPSGNYRSYIQRCSRKISDNIFFISHLHDFKNILLLSDAFIRNTTTDGVSLSIHEARDLGIPVLASAAVRRPPFCSIFQDILKTDLKEKLEEARRLIKLPGEAPDTVNILLGLYQEIEGK
ncbi:Glycosyltransferase involved in cell wall bisynthesis [Dyadobacter sp. SG02]|uniref:glycosyltransferase n=1 Tax=Dyadobacter sp. SG02 TaxID=1855291 RepID=UPI0008C61C8E|nr:glycosyltransferase [Dyadobacter sp. SG02]SEJ43873.1 Glycosyltransferase involved in cell wall bisynthesis [Dyadobacter sp. SG02]